MPLLKRYLPTPRGQIHAYEQLARGQRSEPRLVCLHPAPTSGLFFETVMPRLNNRRHVIAPDYPGYGGSYPLKSPPLIDDYACAMIESLADIDPKAPLDLLGFHTGCLVALHMARTLPVSRIGRIVLVDVPYFTESQRQSLLNSACKPLPLSQDLSSLAPVWDTYLLGKLDQMSIERAFALLVESWRPVTSNHFAFHAAFSYDCETQFAQLDRPVDVIATRSGLRDATLAAAKVLPQSRLHCYDDIEAGVFERYADKMATRILALLDQTEG